MMVRTLIGEANNQPDVGLAAVGHVILNRVQSGKYGGSTPTDVVTANNGKTWQFEPWGSRRSELLSIKPDSPAYQRASSILDGVLGSGPITLARAGRL